MSRGQEQDDWQAREDEQLLQRANIGSDGTALLRFLESETLTAEEQRRIAGLIAQLGDRRFSVRQEASRALVRCGPRALGPIRTACLHPNAEIRRRAERCAALLARQASSEVAAAAVRRLGQLRTPGSAQMLLDYVASAPDALLADEARAVAYSLAQPVRAEPSPTQRARTIAARFLKALERGDCAAVRQASGIPFTLGGSLIFQDRSELDEFFGQVLDEQQSRPGLRYRTLAVIGLREYGRRAPSSEQVFLSTLAAQEIRVVLVHGRFGAERDEHGAVLVRLRGSDGLVVGIGQPRLGPTFRCQAGESPPK